MLSVFPELLFLSPFAAFLIRLALGGVLAYAAWAHTKSDGNLARWLSIPEGTIAILLIAGVWTQPASLAALVVLLAHLLMPSVRAITLGAALLALVMSASLILTGAGAIAFDLPL